MLHHVHQVTTRFLTYDSLIVRAEQRKRATVHFRLIRDARKVLKVEKDIIRVTQKLILVSSTGKEGLGGCAGVILLTKENWLSPCALKYLRIPNPERNSQKPTCTLSGTESSGRFDIAA